VTEASPLTRTQLDEMIKAAKIVETQTAPFVITVPAHTGLSINEFLHLRPEWIYWRDSSMFEEQSCPEIHIPATDTCQNLKWEHSPPGYTSKPGSCHTCEENGRTDGFQVTGFSDAESSSTGRSLSRERIVPVRSNRAEAELRRWFQTLEREGVPFRWNNVVGLIGEVANQADLQRNVDYQDLRWTFTKILADSGVPKENIAEYTGAKFYSGSTPRQILEDSPTEYKFKTLTIDRLRKLAQIEPASSSELAEHSAQTQSTISTVLTRLQEEELVTLVSGQWEGEKPERVFKVSESVDLDRGIACQYCDSHFPSLQGRSIHITRVHDR
jgi:hypothetical protein